MWSLVDLLIKMSTEDDLIRCDNIITAGASKLSSYTGLAPQVPDLQGPVVTAAHHSGGVAQELGGQHFPRVTCSREE